MSNMKQNKPIIYLGSGMIGAIVFALMTFLGYTPEAEGVVKAGAFEFDPAMFRNILAVLIPILIPFINKWWPGVGDLIQKLLGFLLPKEENGAEEPVHHTETNHFCDLHEIGLSMARRGNSKGVDHCANLFKLMLEEATPHEEEIQK